MGNNKLSEEKLLYIEKLLGEEHCLKDEPLAPYMSMRVGGPANYIFMPENAEQIRKLTDVLKEEQIPYYVIGNGTNIIFRDAGFDGAIIRLLDNFSRIEVDGTVITASAGVKLKRLADAALGAGLSGLEFASGIPGSLGGAVTMNAGAYGGEMKDVITKITAMDKDGKILTFTAGEAELTYRHSIFSDGEYIVLEAQMQLQPGDLAEIRALMDDLNGRRRDKQPLEYPSCGSTFKRPEGYFAGKLIADSGLSGARVGGASVSTKHCGFVINDGHGSAQDVLDLIELIKKTVKEKQGVELTCEVRII